MRIVFIGAVQFSERALNELLELRANIVGICTLAESAINSDHVNLSEIAKKFNIPCLTRPNINDQSSLEWVRDLKPDVIFCFGWSYLLKKELLSIPKIGTIGYHPACLPANRGRHPLIWALVLGLSETASTFFFMDEGADSGPILSQEVVSITAHDDATTLYQKITQVALSQIKTFLPQLITNTFIAFPQDDLKSNYWRKRGVLDGSIDWRMAAISIHNLVRALTHPYPGAHFLWNGEKIQVWRVEVVANVSPNIEPGKVLSVDDLGVLVKAGIGAIRLISMSPEVNLRTGDYL